ncbi:MAG: DegT/DnrJ/EryC1/StrS aminotransferase family protein [Magnetococcales bacterium]|nr:DegT/DnrJ/EryC1/StrS aminotransferase family protein [Magnetococcales bacterium]
MTPWPLIPSAARFRPRITAGEHLATLGSLLFDTNPQDGTRQARLESALARRLGVADGATLLTPHARVAIYLAVKSLLQEGRQTVILSPYTIPDVVNMVVCAGGIPRFLDIDPTTCDLDRQAVQAVMNDATGAILVTHLFGMGSDVSDLAAACREKGIALIENAAQAFGVVVNGRAVGTMGDAGVFSFGLGSALSALCGGMLVTPHPRVRSHAGAVLAFFPWMERANLLGRAGEALLLDLVTWPWLFKLGSYWLVRPWLDRMALEKCDVTLRSAFPEKLARRMTPMQAQLLLGKIEGVDAEMRTRIANARRYHAGLSGLPGLRLPPMREDGSHGYPHFSVQCEEREALLRHLGRARRDIALPSLVNCAAHPCFKEYAVPCPNAATIANQTLLLPTYPGYAPAEIDRNIEVIRGFSLR